MLKSLNIMFSKDPNKILQYYDKDSSEKIKIIQKLWDINAVDQLLEVSKIDLDVRDNIIRELIKKHKLSTQHFISILNWLSFSKLLSDIIMFIKTRLSNEDIEKIASSSAINPNAKKLLETVLLQKSNTNQSRINKYTPDEKYLKLKMIIEDSDSFISHNVSDLDSLEKKELDAVANDFLNQFTPPPKNKIEFIKDFLIKNNCLAPCNYDCFLTVINLLDLNDIERIQLLSLLDNYTCFEPEFFMCFTNFKYVSLEQMQSILSMPTVKKWLEIFYENHYYNDLNWLAERYPYFDWVKDSLNPVYSQNIFNSIKIDQTGLLSFKLKRTLCEVVFDKNIIKKLLDSSSLIQNIIKENLTKTEFSLEYHLNALLLIGGKENFSFINELMTRRPVDNVADANAEIEKRYLKFKKDTNDPQKIEVYIRAELDEKAKIIYAGHYGCIMQTWLANISNLKEIDHELKTILLKNLPDIKAYVSDANRDEKLIICKLIGILKLTDQTLVLETFIKSNDLQLQIHAVVSLRNLGFDVSPNIHAFVNSKNVLIRQEFARSLHFFKKDFDQITLVQLATDTNALVCEHALNFIASLDKDTAISVYNEIYTKIQNKTRYHLMKLLGTLKTHKAIPLIVELLRNGDHRIYNDAIKALIQIKHPLSIAILQNMELNKNFILELERAKALITLGDFNGWSILKKYFNISHNYVQNYAKMIFLELANSEQVNSVRKLVSDQNPMIASFAIIKIFLYKEIEGNVLIDALFETNDLAKLYYIGILLSHLPYLVVRDQIKLLMHSDSIKCRTIAIMIMAKNGDTDTMKKFEREILSMDDEAHNDVINTLADFPEKGSFNLLKKVCYFQNPYIIKKSLEILPNYYYENVNDFIKDLWNRTDNNSKILIIDYIVYSQNESLYLFIKSQCDYVSFEVQAHIFRAVINIENSEEAWDNLDNLIRADEKEIKKAAIDALSRIEDQRTINILSRYLSSPFEDIQIEVIKALGNTGNPEVLPLLTKYTESQSPRLKIAMAKALGNLPFKESSFLLDKLVIDRDEYVKVTAEISIEKIEKGNDIKYSSFNNILDNILKDSSWKLSEEWFDREYNLFFTQYNSFKIRPIHDFKKKIILDQDDYLQKTQTIRNELETKLSGNSNINEIIELKKKCEMEIKNYMIKDELVISLLLTESSSLNDEDFQMIYNIIRSNDEILIKSIVLNAAKFHSPIWIEFINVIASEKSNYLHTDIIVYALSHEYHFKNLQTLALLLSNDRARFYFLMLYNYFLVHTKNIDQSCFQNIYKNIALAVVEPRIKTQFAELIKKLERINKP